MHPDSHLLMQQFKSGFCEQLPVGKVLDVGSQDINGTYRPYFPGWEYVGLDVVAGNGVDVVCEKIDSFPFPDQHFDVIISGQTLEHAERPWETVKEMARVLKPGGMICLIAPWRFHVHKDALCPFDRWRILEDGMRVLLTDAKITILDCRQYGDDTIGIGKKEIPIA